MSHLYRRRKVYWYGGYAGGRKVRRSLKTYSRRVALARKAALDILFVGRRARYTHESPTLPQLIDQYLASAEPQRGRAWHDTNRRRLRTIAAALGPVPVHELTPLRVQAALDQVALDRKLRSSTARDYLMEVRALFRWAADHELLDRDPTKPLRAPPAREVERAWLTEAQRDAVLALAAKSPEGPLLAAAFYTGLRWKELAGLRWEDINWEARMLTVRAATTKSRRSRTIPLHPKLASALRVLREESGLVFGGMDRRAYQRQLKLLKRWFRQVGVRGDRLGLHTCRHTFTTLLLQAGVSIWKVAGWDGHAGVEVTEQRYAHQAMTYDRDIEAL